MRFSLPFAASLARLAPRQIALLKRILFALSLLPAARLVVGAATDKLGANPVEFLTRSTGTWTLVFLCVTLAVTPVRRLTGWNWLLRYRRMFGLFAFFYAPCHFTTYIWFDQYFDIAAVIKDIVKRPFIAVGFAAFVLLIPLAATSFNRAINAIGAKRWQWLHRAVYVIAPLGVLHYWWHKAGKNDFTEPLIYGAIIVLLLAARLAWRTRSAQRVGVQRAT